MTLPSTGTISMSQVATELGISATGLNLNDSRVRTLANVSSGAIGFSNLRGKSSLSAVGNDSTNNSYSSTSNGGTASSFPSVTPSGGNGTYTYAWSFTSNPSGCSISSTTIQNPTVSKTFVKLSNGSYSAVLQCVVTSNGVSVTVSNIQAGADWFG